MPNKESIIHPSAVIAGDIRLGSGVIIGPNCVIENDVSIGSGTQLDANVVIGKGTDIGCNNHFFANCVIGTQPQLLDMNPDSKRGRLSIGDNNIIREQVTIHPGMHPSKPTKIGNENMIMIGVHIGHDCVLEDKIVMSNYSQASGHCRIEIGVWLSGMVLLHQFTTLGKWCYAAGFAGINRDVPPFVIVSGHYPPRVRTINKRGLKRAGLSEEQQKKIVDAYKKLYRRGNSLLENAKKLAKQDGLDENVKAMVEAITRSNQHRFGRYLELFRD